MRPSTTTLLAVAAVALALMSGVHATPETTCKAAADNDKRVDYKFCVSELSRYRGGPDADTWGLAKVAALVGVNNAGSTVNDIKEMLARPGTDDRARAALGRCQELYFSMELALAEAHDDINSRDYTAGKEKAGEAISLAHQCDDIFAKAAVPSPLTQRSSYSVKIAIVCTAITNLIK